VAHITPAAGARAFDIATPLSSDPALLLTEGAKHEQTSTYYPACIRGMRIG
jgi:hypothetical protein